MTYGHYETIRGKEFEQTQRDKQKNRINTSIDYQNKEENKKLT